MEVEKYLLEIGVRPHLKGFYFLADAINWVIEDKSYLKSITKKLYVELAKKHGETPSKTERAMRHAIRSSGSYLSISEFISRTAINFKATIK